MRSDCFDNVLPANVRMGLPVFSQLVGRKSQPLVEFCLLFIREVHIPCEALEFIFDRLTLFIAKTHCAVPFQTGNLNLAPVSPSSQAIHPRTTPAGKRKTSSSESPPSKVSPTNLRPVLYPIDFQLSNSLHLPSARD